MTKVNVQDAKTQLSRLLAVVESGEEVTIARYGKPVARLVAVATPAADRVPGTWKGLIEMADDFDDEMPVEWMEPSEPSEPSESSES